MVGPGNWAIPDLIEYLVSIQSTLQPAEIETLRDNPAFLEEATAEQNRNGGGTPRELPKLKPSNLYKPSDVFRSLGLPIIDWRGSNGGLKWRSSSKEGTPDTV